MTRTHTICRRCGFGVPADAPICPGCRRPAVDDWRARVKEFHRREQGAHRSPSPPLRGAGYHSLLPTATVARALLGLAATAAVATAVAMGSWTFLVDDPVILFESTEVDVAAVARGITIGFLAVLVVTALAFTAWAVQAHRNLPVLKIEDRRDWTIWLNRWWWSFLVTPAVVVLAVVTTRGGLDEFDQQRVVGGLCVAAATTITVAAAAARRMIAVVTVAQARRADVIVDLRDHRRAAMDRLLAMDRSRS